MMTNAPISTTVSVEQVPVAQELSKLMESETHLSVGSWTSGWFNEGLNLIESGLVGLHEVSGMPWWACIMGTTLALRVGLLPARLAAQRSSLLMGQVMAVAQAHKQTLETKLNYKLARIRNEQERETKRRTGTLEIQREFMFKWSELSRKYKVGALRAFLPVAVNIPFFITMTSCYRKMSSYPHLFGEAGVQSLTPGFTQEGLLWFTNLAIPDYGLTGLLLATNTLFLEVMFRTQPNTLQPGTNVAQKSRKVVRYVLHGANLLSFVVLSTLPVSLNLFVLSSSLISMFETLILRHPRIQAWLLRNTPKTIQ